MSAAPTDNRLTVLVFVILAGVALLLVCHDWLMVGLGGAIFPAYWAAVLAWLVCILFAIRRQRRWWLLLTASVVLYPAVRVAAFLVECSQKACIF